MTRRLSALTRRRLHDGERAMAVSTDGETKEELQDKLEVIKDGIRALQSTDDLGEDMNRRVYEQERELWKRYREVEGRIKALDQRDGT